MKDKEYGGFNSFSPDRKNANALFSDSRVYSMNLARNALELLLEVRQPNKVYAPYYTCHSIHKVLNRMVPEVSYYHIDENFYPIIPDLKLDNDHLILVNNYFGVFEEPVKYLIGKYGDQVVIDNAQGFYTKFPDYVDQICSPRKFFGVTDGGLLYTEQPVAERYQQLDTDQSAERISHLFKCEETSKNYNYQAFLVYRNSIQDLKPMKMSVSTRAILKTVDIKHCRAKRLHNFVRMDKVLRKYNKIQVKLDNNCAPMCYPFLHEYSHLKGGLIKERIYVGSYWPISTYASKSVPFEVMLRDKLCCLPIDQSMTRTDVDFVSNKVIDILRRHSSG